VICGPRILGVRFAMFLKVTPIVSAAARPKSRADLTDFLVFLSAKKLSSSDLLYQSYF
jgi:hypothetical protein